MQAASTYKPKMISKAGLWAATLRLTHSQISFCRISGTHASVYCLTTWWAWDWVIVFPDWHVWQADEQAAPAEPADSSEKKDLRSSYSLNCNLWFSLSQFEHLHYRFSMAVLHKELHIPRDAKLPSPFFWSLQNTQRIVPNESHWTGPRSSETKFSVGPMSCRRNGPGNSSCQGPRFSGES